MFRSIRAVSAIPLTVHKTSQWNVMLRSHHWIIAVFAVWLACLDWGNLATGREQAGEGELNPVAPADLIEVPIPLRVTDASSLVQTLTVLSEEASTDGRRTIVLRYGSDEGAASDGSETAFEDALRLARAISGPKLRKLKIVSWVTQELSGHLALPIAASDLLVMHPQAAIVSTTDEADVDAETIELNYQAIAKRRKLFPAAMVSALLDPASELVLVSRVDGQQEFATGQTLSQLRTDGELLGEEVWSQPGQPVRLDAARLRKTRIAAGLAENIDELSNVLGISGFREQDNQLAGGEAKGVLLEIVGSITNGRSSRWQSNLAHSLKSGDINTWLIAIDSIGGSLETSATLAGWLAEAEPPVRQVVGYVRGEARGDAVLIAMACKPLSMKPTATLGGGGADAFSQEDWSSFDELIEQIGQRSNRPTALIRGLLDPSLKVFRFKNRKTGRIRYATVEDMEQELIDRAAAANKQVSDFWDRGERIDMSAGLTAKEAIALGLADGQCDTLDEAASRAGLAGAPPPVVDRPLVRLVERLGRNTSLCFLLLVIGFSALSTEMSAPGVGFPGFLALVCFALFCWIKFLAGTAEWFEFLMLSMGLICIAVEVFVLPGFGVFGVGGLILTVIGVVLMSQTFVIPTTGYQVQLFARGMWVAVGGLGGTVLGIVVIRSLFPHIPMFRHLVMETPDGELLDEAEKLGDYSHLMSQQGITTTPLRPSGRARFGDEIIQVVSDGTPIDPGQPIVVCEVHATRVIVEPVQSSH